MNKKGLIGILFLLALVAGFFSWFSVDRAINVPGADVWVVPGIFFSSLIIVYYLSAVLIRDIKIMAALIVVTLLPSLFFAANFLHSIDIIIGLVFLLLAVTAIGRELKLGIKINPYKAFKAGNFFVIMAISFVISTQYFFEVKDLEAARQIPKLPTQKISNLIVPRVLAITNPEFKNMNDEKLTVDQFIAKTQGKQFSVAEEDAMIDKQIGRSISSEERFAYRREFEKQISSAQDLAFIQSREKLSEMAGRTLSGDEKISDVLAQKIDNSIAEFVTPTANSNDFPALPISMAIILFLSVFSLGSLLSMIWISVAGAIFGVLVKAGVVSVRKIMQEVEVLE